MEPSEDHALIFTMELSENVQLSSRNIGSLKILLSSACSVLSKQQSCYVCCQQTSQIHEILDKDGNGATVVVEVLNLNSINVVAEFLNQGDNTHHFIGPVRGIFGYNSPDYVVSDKPTTDVDAFSLGVVVLQVVYGRMLTVFNVTDFGCSDAPTILSNDNDKDVTFLCNRMVTNLNVTVMLLVGTVVQVIMSGLCSPLQGILGPEIASGMMTTCIPRNALIVLEFNVGIVVLASSNMMSVKDVKFLIFLSRGSTNDYIMYMLKDSLLDGGFILESVNYLLDALFSVKGNIKEVFYLDLFWRRLIRSVRE